MKSTPITATLGMLFLSCWIPAQAADAPWSMSRERYAIMSDFHSGAGPMTFQELASGGVTVVSHVPGRKEYFQEAAAWGVKVCPYVSFYKVAVSGDGIAWESPNRAYPELSMEPFWREIDAAKHPEWFLRREDGAIRKPFDNPNYQKCFQQSCCNHRELMEAYERGVRNFMDLGAGGVFIDNVHPYSKCFGAKLGLHEHDWPDKDNAECYLMALKKVRDAVKSYGENMVVVLNTGGRSAEYASFGDAQMWESWCWEGSKRNEPRSKDDLMAIYSRWQPFGEKGYAITALTYLPRPDHEAEDAFFAYTAAQLAGSEQWTATCSSRRDILRRLYRIRTGPALDKHAAIGETIYRHFQNAIIICNFAHENVQVRIPVPSSFGPELVELYDMQAVPTVDGQMALTMPPESGRVVVSRQAALDNLLREVHGQAVAIRLYLEKNDAARNDVNISDARGQLQAVEDQTDNLQKTVSQRTSHAEAELETLATAWQKAADLPISSQPDSFLTERIENLRRHILLLIGLLRK